MRPWKRGRLLVPGLVVGVSLGLLVVLALLDGEADPAPERGVPDLTMAPPSDLRVEARDDGGFDLRFTSVMENAGAADLVLSGERGRASGEWTIVQEIGSGPDLESRATGALPVWGGDGHDHWHIVGAARYRLEVPGGTERVDEKVGFCIFDGAITSAGSSGDTPTYVEPGCGDGDSDVVEMGLSAGWGDPYRSTLPGQLVDISGLRAGRYRLRAWVDPEGLFEESRTDNNEAWTDFELSWDESGSPAISVLPTPG